MFLGPVLVVVVLKVMDENSRSGLRLACLMQG